MSKNLIKLFDNKNFLILSAVIFAVQSASSFLMMTLVLSVFSQTKSNFAVSGIIIAIALSIILLMGVAGVLADIFDRKKIVITSILFLNLIAFLIFASLEKIGWVMILAFFYNASSSFLLPATSASIGQIVGRDKLQTANSIFVFTLACGQIVGLFLAASAHFFFGAKAMLIIPECFLIASFFLSLLLPRLHPRDGEELSAELILAVLKDTKRAFLYVFGRKSAAFFFLALAFFQGIIAIGVTLGPGFFQEVIGLSIEKSPIFIEPFVGLGVLLGSIFAQNRKLGKGFLINLSFMILGVCTFSLGLFLNFIKVHWQVILGLMAPLLVFMGACIVIPIIAARTILQEKTPHNYQGTVFGASIILSALLAALFSLAAASLETALGYINILIWGGAAFILAGLISSYFTAKWKY